MSPPAGKRSWLPFAYRHRRQNGLPAALVEALAQRRALLQLPKAFRQELHDAGVATGRSKLYSTSESKDGTRKFLCQLADGHVVETVGIPFDAEHGQRLTACISSQVRSRVDF